MTGLPKLETLPEIAAELRALSARMIHCGIHMEHFGGLGPMAIHGRQMYGAGRIVREWAEAIEAEHAHPPDRQCACHSCAPSFAP